MKLHFIRNATLVIESGDRRILVDPMLGPKGCLPPMALFRHRPRMNPLVDLPTGTREFIDTATHALLTHRHPDHLDGAGTRFLAAKRLPVFCNPPDEAALRRRHLITQPIPQGVDHPFLGGTIRSVPTEHGYGLLLKLMGPGVGYFLRLPDEPSLYLAGDTVLTPAVRHTLEHLRPEVTVFPAGTAQLDFGRPILMPIHEMLEFVRLCPGIAAANHLEALNHCPTSRAELARALMSANLNHRCRIPLDGEVIEFQR